MKIDVRRLYNAENTDMYSIFWSYLNDKVFVSI